MGITWEVINMTTEIWQPIKGYEGYYEVSNLGRVRSLDRYVHKNNGSVQFWKGRVCALWTDKNGYKALSLRKNHTDSFRRVCRLVAETFIPNPENKPTVNHINGIKDDDRVENLEWNTYSENMQHAYDTKLNENPKGEDHHLVKITEEDVKTIREIYASGKMNQRELAELYGLRQPAISRIIHKKRWKHIS